MHFSGQPVTAQTFLGYHNHNFLKMITDNFCSDCSEYKWYLPGCQVTLWLYISIQTDYITDRTINSKLIRISCSIEKSIFSIKCDWRSLNSKQSRIVSWNEEPYFNICTLIFISIFPSFQWLDIKPRFLPVEPIQNIATVRPRRKNFCCNYVIIEIEWVVCFYKMCLC